MRLDEEQPAAPYHIPLHPKASAPPPPPSGIQGLRVRTGCFFQALVDTPQWQRAKSGNQASLLRNRFFSGGEKRMGDYHQPLPELSKMKVIFPLMPSLCRFCVLQPLRRYTGLSPWPRAVMLPQSAPPGPTAIRSAENGRFHDPTPELVHQNLWVGVHLEIYPETSFWGTKPFMWEKAPRAESSWQVPQLVQLQVECFGRKRGLGAGSPPSWYREEHGLEPGVLCPPSTFGSHIDTSVSKSSGASSPQCGEAEGPVS